MNKALVCSRSRLHFYHPKVLAEEVVEPPVVWLEVLLKTTPGGRVHTLLVAALVAFLGYDFPGFELPVGQAEEVEGDLEGLLRALEEVLALSTSICSLLKNLDQRKSWSTHAPLARYGAISSLPLRNPAAGASIAPSNFRVSCPFPTRW
jgi:uncharacterized Zn-finger protein